MAQELNITNINMTGTAPNRKVGLALNSLFLNCKNNHHFGVAHFESVKNRFSNQTSYYS